MNKDVALICKNQSFMVNAMIKNLEEEHFKVETLQPKINELKNLEEKSRIVLVYLDKDADEMTDALVYLKDLVTEDRQRLMVYFVGNPDDFDAVEKIYPKSHAEGFLLRPLNVKKLVEQLNGAAENMETENRKKNILVVDDDGTMLRMLKMWLSEKYSVYMANSGMNAISLLAKNHVDLILLDYEMPVANGPQVLEMIRSEPTTADTPVMFLTAKNDKESVMSVMGLKPEKYLLKTMPPDELLKNIDDFFETQKAKQSVK